jgi:hypothetical protein
MTLLSVGLVGSGGGSRERDRIRRGASVCFCCFLIFYLKLDTGVWYIQVPIGFLRSGKTVKQYCLLLRLFFIHFLLHFFFFH